jgi:hypothetical protein
MGKQNRDIPLGGPTTVTDTTSYGRIATPEIKSPSKKEQKELKEREKESGNTLEKFRKELDKDPYKPLNSKP